MNMTEFCICEYERIYDNDDHYPESMTENYDNDSLILRRKLTNLNRLSLQIINHMKCYRTE